MKTMMSDKKEEQAVMKEMVEEVAKNVAAADINKAVEAAKQEAIATHAQPVAPQAGSPPIVGQIVVTKYMIAPGQFYPKVDKGGVWTVDDLLKLADSFTAAARQQVIGDVKPEEPQKS
jgi:hypothetical protein